ncbi:ATP-binding protein [Paenibacillus macerans]|nr:ATP-binding protein [Paenibacillus macerans]GIP13417.1 hypothetical protein J1TS5_55870 [Paenibacillus macerans]
MVNFLLFIFVKYSNHIYKELLDQQSLNCATKSAMRYYDYLDKSQNDIRKIKHDMRNTLLTLQGLLIDRRLDEAEKVTAEILAEIKNTETQKYTPDNVLNYLLSEKIRLAAAKNIKVSVHCLLPEAISLNNKIISVIFGNLLDNAIEACDKVTEGEKEINLNIKYCQAQLYIEISNSFNPKVTGRRLATNKLNRREHGFGLKSIKQIVQRNSGILDIKTNENKFYVSILLQV